MVKCSPYLDWNSKELWASEEALEPVDTTARGQHHSHTEFRPKGSRPVFTLIDSMVFHGGRGDAFLHYKCPGMPERIKMPAVKNRQWIWWRKEEMEEIICRDHWANGEQSWEERRTDVCYVIQPLKTVNYPDEKNTSYKKRFYAVKPSHKFFLANWRHLRISFWILQNMYYRLHKIFAPYTLKDTLYMMIFLII